MDNEKTIQSKYFYILFYISISVYVLYLFIFPSFRTGYSKYVFLLIAVLGLIAYKSIKKATNTKIKQALFTLTCIAIISAPFIAGRVPYVNTDLLNEYEFTCSMYHQERDFNKWWELNKGDYEKFNISKEQFEAFPFKNGIDRHIDLFWYFRKVDFDTIKVGDLLIYNVSWNDNLISHRVIRKVHMKDINWSKITIKGDNSNVVEIYLPEMLFMRKFEDNFLTRFSGMLLLKDGCREKYA